MRKPEDLRQAADEMLGGLTASRQTLQHILQPEKSRRPYHQHQFKRLAAAALALLLVAGAGFSLNLLQKPKTNGIETKAAGQLPDNMSVSALAVPRGSITLKAEGGTPGYLGLWAAGSGANFPLVAAEGRYYRLLTNPTAIDSSMLGNSLGSVSVFTAEPALENASSAVVSNVVAQGTEVFAVKGMENAAVAAMVDGNLRVFQRVAFSGNALIGSENLASALGKGKVVALQLSGVGTVTDPQTVDMLMGLLKNNAIYKGSSTRSGQQALLIQYDNHIVLQMTVKDNDLIACGTYSCVDFISAFASSVQ